MSQLPTLPEPKYPLLVNLFTEDLLPQPPQKDPQTQRDIPAPKVEMVQWALGSHHPYIPTMTIMRMFILSDTIEVYSRANDGTCMRDTIPLPRVRLAQEGMPPEVFGEEIVKASEAEDDEDDGDDGDDGSDQYDDEPAPAVTSNGQTATP